MLAYRRGGGIHFSVNLPSAVAQHEEAEAEGRAYGLPEQALRYQHRI
jgi:hypothetical protein